MQSGHKDERHYRSGDHSPWTPRRPFPWGEDGGELAFLGGEDPVVSGSSCSRSSLPLGPCGPTASLSESTPYSETRTTPPGRAAESTEQRGRQNACSTALARGVRAVSVGAPAWRWRRRPPCSRVCSRRPRALAGGRTFRKLLLRQEVAYFPDNLHFIPSTSHLRLFMTLSPELLLFKGIF